MKLTEMKSRDIFTSKTTPEDVEKIVFSGDNLSKNQAHNNVAVLLGGPGMIPYRADKGIWLYEEQKVEKVLVSGGIGYLNTDRTTPEAFKMRDYLLSQGIPDKRYFSWTIFQKYYRKYGKFSSYFRRFTI